VEDIEDAIKQMKENNVRCLNEKPKIGAHGKLVVFLHPKDCNGVLVELEQTH
jgi:methylmalonyl-CoA/ethylmalonyl-CoA epimerase